MVLLYLAGDMVYNHDSRTSPPRLPYFCCTDCTVRYLFQRGLEVWHECSLAAHFRAALPRQPLQHDAKVERLPGSSKEIHRAAHVVVAVAFGFSILPFSCRLF